MLENIGEGIVLTNERGLVDYVNPAFVKMTGYSNEDLVGEDFAATIEGGNEWQDKSDKEDYYLIGFLISFVYEGETITRTISLPNLIQELT